MNFFKKLFGTKSNSSDEKVELELPPLPIPKIEVIVTTHEIKAEPIKEKSAKNDVKKRATTIKNEQGFKAAADYLIENLNTTQWELKDKIALLKKTIPYFLSAYPSKADALLLINGAINEYDLQEYSAKQITEMGEVFALVANDKAIEFLESQMDLFFKAKKDKEEFWFDIYVMFNSLFNLYLKENNFDFALVTMRKVILKGINWNNPSFAIEFLIRMYSDISDMYLIEKKNPKYVEYFVNKIKSIVLESVHDYFSLSTYDYETFEKLIETKGKADIYFDEWDETDLKALELLNIKDIQQFSEMFSRYIYNDAPLLVGNFESVLDNKTLNRIKRFREKNISEIPDAEYDKYAKERDEIEKLNNKIQSCFNASPMDIMVNLHKAVLGLLNIPETV